MFAEERQQIILKKVFADKAVTVKELSRLFGVSMPTIRSDLDAICALNPHIDRAHGGIVLSNSDVSKLTSYEERKAQNLEEKKQIATLAANMINHQDTIMIDSSSTCFEIAIQLENTEKNVTIITTSLNVAIKLKENPNLTVIIIGGLLKPKSITVQNSFDDNIINAFNVDKYFFSASGISYENGFSDYNYNEVIDKRKFLSKSRQSIALIDSSKFDIVSKSSFAQLVEVNYLITSSNVNHSITELYRKKINMLIS